MSVKVLCFLFRHKAHTENMLTCSTNVHGEQIVHSLHIESLSVQLSVSVTLSWNSGGIGSWQEPFQICVLVDCRARLTDLVAAVITAIVCRRHCGLIHRYQSSRWAKSWAPGSERVQSSVMTQRSIGSTTAEKPHADRGQP